MALIHEIESPETGITASYWKLTHLQADFTAGIVDAQLHGYRDAAARTDGRAPVARHAFRFPLASVARRGSLTRGAIYAAIRAESAGLGDDGTALPPLFADATDI